MRLRFFLTTACLAYAPYIAAQNPATGHWGVYFGTFQVAPKWAVFSDFQYRTNPAPTNQVQSMLRLGLQRNLGPNQSILLGAAYVPTRAVGRVPVAEFRVFEQYVRTHRIHRAYIRHRIRLEQRFLSEDILAHRLRYFIQVNLPRSSKGMVVGTPYLAAYNELFIQRGTQGFFDRNRVYAGLGYVCSQTLRMELGPMAQTTPAGTLLQWNLVLHHNINALPK